MSLIKLTTSGTAWLSSKSDPRWNVTIYCRVGCFSMPKELEIELKEKEKKYGKQPEDLEWGYMKD
jgi:hypothetical protein